METKKNLDALVSAGMKIEEVATWLESHQNNSSGIVQSIFPVVYKKGTNFEVLPHLDLSRKAEVWGFELLPGIVLAKKCGADSNVESTTWHNCKAFAEQIFLNGKKGSLPSKDVLKQQWSEKLRGQIQAMDKLLCDNGIDGETRSGGDPGYVGIPWCSEVNDDLYAYYFFLRNGYLNWNLKVNTYTCDRLAVAFLKVSA